MNEPIGPDSRQFRALQELEQAMRGKEDFLQQCRRILGEHYSGVVILVHCYDEETQAAISRFVTSGDPFACRALAQKFLNEQAIQEQHLTMMRLNSFRNGNENQPPIA